MDYGFDYSGGYDPSGGAYDPRLDPSAPDTGGAYDPRLDPTNPAGGAYDPRLDTGQQGGGAVTQPGAGLSLADILKMFGGVPGLMSLIGPAIGGIMAKNSTSKANDFMQQAIKDANAQITTTLGGSGAMFAPYQQAGLQGLQGMQNFAPSNFASRYRPLGTGAAMGGGYTPMGGGGLSLGTLAKGR